MPTKTTRSAGHTRTDAILGQLRSVAADRADWKRLGLDLELRAQAWVSEARTAGASWTEIGTALRLSKQGAQQRYGA